jgi:hypothetical protein
MRRAKGPNHPPSGSTKVNGQDPTRPRKVDANLMTQADDDDYSEHDDSHQYGNEWQTDDSLAFLSRFGDNDSDNSPGYPPADSAPTRATAFMMDDMGTILLDDNDTPAQAVSDLTPCQDQVGAKPTHTHVTMTPSTDDSFYDEPYVQGFPRLSRASTNCE